MFAIQIWEVILFLKKVKVSHKRNIRNLKLKFITIMRCFIYLISNIKHIFFCTHNPFSCEQFSWKCTNAMHSVEHHWPLAFRISKRFTFSCYLNPFTVTNTEDQLARLHISQTLKFRLKSYDRSQQTFQPNALCSPSSTNILCVLPLKLCTNPPSTIGGNNYTNEQLPTRKPALHLLEFRMSNAPIDGLPL